jgi:FAD/FMN-containing dehydrogenase/Fe-S oxidoreductase
MDRGTFIAELDRRVRGRVLFDAHTRGLYATDASIYQVRPIGVVEPADVEDAAEALRVCGAWGVGVLPRGGGTSLAGQCVNEAVVIDVSARCTGVVSVDAGARRCVVEPGVTVDDLNDAIRAEGLFFAPDPSTASQATIGGCIGNNAAGVHSILYGRTSENVSSIDACLWDGSRVTLGAGSAVRDARVMGITREVMSIVRAHAGLIRERFPRTKRRSAGYQLDVILDQCEASGWDPGGVNLSHLLCGSEGTLAMTLGAELILREIPRCKGLAVIACSSVDEAIGLVEPMLALGPAGVELLDDLILRLARQNTQYRRYVELLPDDGKGGDPQAVLYVEFFAQDPGEIEEKLEAAAGLAGGSAVETYTDPDSMARAWKLRKAGEPLLHAVEGERKPLGFIEDSAIPVENLGEYVRRLRAIVEGEGTVASYYAHASVGVLHVRPLLDLRDARDEGAMHRIAGAAADLAKELGGVASGEHGDGRARGPVLERFLGSELMGALREVKRVFDPHGLMNPGNIVSPGALESISRNTRVRPGSVNLTIDRVETGFRYDDEHGFGHAIEMCNGAGVCRKKAEGTMCPSYQGTLDERHSTRGRGNALRLAITGQSRLGADGGAPDFDDFETLETLKLCLGCKACKTECPSNVDMAKLKSEYLYQNHGLNGLSFRTRAYSHVDLLNRIGSLSAPMANFANGLAPVRSVVNHVMGIHPERSLPRFHRSVRTRPIPLGDRDAVVVVSDTMVTHTEPWIAHAAVDVLTALGYRVGLVTCSDFGRSAISQGDLDHAKKDAKKQLKRIAGFVGDRAVGAYLFLEPSFLSAVLDDWKDLIEDPESRWARELRTKSALVETFVGAREHPIRVEASAGDQRMKVHTHCHQKALWGSATTMDAMSEVAPGRAELIDAGCCGMCGSFGYGEEMFELSMTIGEQRLMPAVRARGEGEWVVANGTSCRHQILDATGVRASHPIEAIGALMGVVDLGARPAH